MQKIRQAVVLAILACTSTVGINATTKIDLHDIPHRAHKRSISLQRWMDPVAAQFNQAVHQSIKKPMMASSARSATKGTTAKKASATLADANSAQRQAKTEFATAKKQATSVAGNQDDSEQKIHLPSTTGLMQFNYSYAKSSSGQGNSDERKHAPLKVYGTPSIDAKVVSTIATKQDFTVKQGDWVRIETSDGISGWAKIADIEQNINNAWDAAYQVVLNGQSSSYTVSKISAQAQKERYAALQKQYAERAKRLSQLWDDAFTVHTEAEKTEINALKEQVAALSKTVNALQGKQDTTNNS